MSDSNRPGEIPPDLPPEYADAYRRAYERAYRAGTGAEPEPTEPTERWEGLDRLLEEPPRRVQDAPSHRAPEEVDGQRPAWLVPALLAGLVAVLLLGAYGAGVLFASSVDEADTSPEKPEGVALSEGGEDSPEPTKAPGRTADRYRGPVDAASVGGARASCEAAPSVDAAGNEIRYQPANVYDGDLSTAWRCDGDGVGQTLTLTLAEPIDIGEVGLVPGYAKTDPRSGVDRYAENNRITRVRWTFADGSSVVQRLDGSATNRDLQTVRVPLTRSGEVVVEVLESTPGARNTIAVSEVRIGRASG